MNSEWKNNPKLAGIDKSKLDMLQNMAQQGNSKSPTDLLPFLMGVVGQGKRKGMHFRADEISAIIEVMKIGKSPQETAKLDHIVQMFRMMQ